MKNLYIAGKINKHDFRRQDETLKKILNQFDDKSELSTLSDILSRGHCSLNNSVDYIGPFPSQMSHASDTYRQGLHGSRMYDKSDLNDTRERVQGICQEGIKMCDVFFAFFEKDSGTAYGTVAEIGYAKALGKKIIIAGEYNDDLWFAYAMADFVIPTINFGKALAIVLKDMD